VPPAQPAVLDSPAASGTALGHPRPDAADRYDVALERRRSQALTAATPAADPRHPVTATVLTPDTMVLSRSGEEPTASDLVVSATLSAARYARRLGALRVVTPVPSPLPLAHGLPASAPRPAPWLWGRRIVAVGPLTGRARLDELIMALADQPSDVDLILLGAGPARARLRTEAERHRLAHRVHVDEHPTWAEVDAHLAHADVVVSCSTGDEGPFSLLRAMQLGRPVVARDTEDRRRLISSEVDGILVPRAEANGLSVALHDLLLHRPLADALGAAGARRVASRTWADVGAELRHHLDAVATALA
jgi:glycosyltransferase involved in cell wall biosynthesis